EESISREAGADAGEYTSAEEIQALVRAMGRIPVERTTLYGRVQRDGEGGRETANHAGHGAGGWRGRGPVPLGPHPAHRPAPAGRSRASRRRWRALTGCARACCP